MAEDVFGIVGTLIAGAYHVEGVVAEGGFGVVYRARTGDAGDPVALKLLQVPRLNTEQQAEFSNLLRAEAERLLRLSANLSAVVRPLRVEAFRTSDGRFVPFLVLEWLDGQAFAALIRQRNEAGLSAVPLRKLVRLLTPVARALEHAHHFNDHEGARSIVHGDLKPGNLFVAQVAGEEAVKVLGFGTSAVKGALSRMSQGRNGVTTFTLAYGAPEQWAPQQYGPIGPWTDVWGLALCLVELIAARPLIAGDPATMMGIALDSQRRPTPRSEGVDVADAVEAVFARALALEPRARQRDVGSFWNELVAALQGPEIEPRPRPSGSPPRVRPSPAAQRALALDLEFDPLSAPAPAPVHASSVSGSHYVPDLELAPRRASGAQVLQPAPVSQPMALDLDDASQDSGPALDLDLPADEPVLRRTVSSQRLPAVREPSSSGPISGVMSTRSSNPALESSASQPLRAVRASVPPEAARHSPPPRTPSMASIPPPSSDAGAPLDAGFVVKVELDLPEERSLLRRLRAAMASLLGAVLVALVDPIYAAATGEVLKILGLRLSLLAGALLLLALGLGIRELVREPLP
ncbi:MAG: hypothetical protein ABW061_10645 [Polyangiaceae bacterium]